MNKTRTNTARNIVIGTAAALIVGAATPVGLNRYGIVDLNNRPPVSWFRQAREIREEGIYGCSASKVDQERDANELKSILYWSGGYEGLLRQFKTMAANFRQDNKMWANELLGLYEQLQVYQRVNNVDINFSRMNMQSVEEAREIVQETAYKDLKFGLVFRCEGFVNYPTADSARGLVFAHDFLLEWADAHSKAPNVTDAQRELVDRARKVAFGGGKNELYLRPFGAKEQIFQDGMDYFRTRVDMLADYQKTGKSKTVSVETYDNAVWNGPIWVGKTIAPEALAASLAHTYDYIRCYSGQVGLNAEFTPEQLKMVEYARKLSGVQDDSSNPSGAVWTHTESSLRRAGQSVKDGIYRYADDEPSPLGYWFKEDKPTNVGPEKPAASANAQPKK